MFGDMPMLRKTNIKRMMKTGNNSSALLQWFSWSCIYCHKDYLMHTRKQSTAAVVFPSSTFFFAKAKLCSLFLNLNSQETFSNVEAYRFNLGAADSATSWSCPTRLIKMISNTQISMHHKLNWHTYDARHPWLPCKACCIRQRRRRGRPCNAAGGWCGAWSSWCSAWQSCSWGPYTTPYCKNTLSQNARINIQENMLPKDPHHYYPVYIAAKQTNRTSFVEPWVCIDADLQRNAKCPGIKKDENVEETAEPKVRWVGICLPVCRRTSWCARARWRASGSGEGWGSPSVCGNNHAQTDLDVFPEGLDWDFRGRRGERNNWIGGSWKDDYPVTDRYICRVGPTAAGRCEGGNWAFVSRAPDCFPRLLSICVDYRNTPLKKLTHAFVRKKISITRIMIFLLALT